MSYVDEIKKRAVIGAPRLRIMWGLKDGELKKLMKVMFADKVEDPYLYGEQAQVVRRSVNDIPQSIEIIGYSSIEISQLSIMVTREGGGKEELLDLGNESIVIDFGVACSRHCRHPQELIESSQWGGKRCGRCLASVDGWYCPDSPDKSCHYFSRDGKIRLDDGSEVPVPDGHSRNNESYDW